MSRSRIAVVFAAHDDGGRAEVRGPVAFALTWTTPEALHALAEGDEREPEVLTSIAKAFGLDLVFVDSEARWAPDAVRRLHAADVAVAWSVGGVLTRIAHAVGWSDMLTALAATPKAMAGRIEASTRDVVASVRAGVHEGADVIVIADEVSSHAGWLVSPDFVFEALVPSYALAVEEAARRELPTVFHSDGDIRVLYPALRKVGFAGVHVAPADPVAVGACVDAARTTGLVVVGGLHVGAVRESGARRAGESAAALAAGGRLVFADDGGITSAVEIAAFGAALDVARERILTGGMVDE